MTLMNFKDPKEREAVLGPLFETAATVDIPAFGPDKFTTTKTTALLKAAVKKALQSTEDPVVDLLAAADSKLSSNVDQVAQSLGPELSRLEIMDKATQKADASSLADTTSSKKTHSSRELHDKSHYSVIDRKGSSKSYSELLTNVMLQRALDGYLFNCKLNKSIVADDPWLQGVWDWIEGKLESSTLTVAY